MTQPNITITPVLLNQTMRQQVAKVFYQAFREKIHHLELFPKSKDQAIRILYESMDVSSGIYALCGNEVVGVIGIKWADGRNFMQFGFNTLRREFGLWGATWRYAIQWAERFFTHIPKNAVHVRGIAVAESMRGRGVGTMLLDAFAKRAISDGFTNITLEVIDTNPKARQLYERLGFSVIRRSYYGWLTQSAGFTSADFMSKTLSE
ncbi:MAG: GNAT family N-acetyltransferase [Anaerolineae bacterium]|nr:GNAT family N-acetyltransferase [Anaerolineae bacterium]